MVRVRYITDLVRLQAKLYGRIEGRGAYQPMCSTTPVARAPFCTMVLSISGIGFSSKIPSSSPSTGKLTLIALHFAVSISTPRQFFDR